MQYYFFVYPLVLLSYVLGSVSKLDIKLQYLIAKAKIIKKGKTTCYIQTNIYNDKDDLVATMDSNYFFVE